MFVLSSKKEKLRVSAGTLRSIMPKLEKVKAGMEQSSCRTVSLKRNARAANRKQSSLM